MVKSTSTGASITHRGTHAKVLFSELLQFTSVYDAWKKC